MDPKKRSNDESVMQAPRYIPAISTYLLYLYKIFAVQYILHAQGTD